MISVIVPLYNKEISISSTIKSILEQTFQDFEIIVVNDGSTDDSLAVIEKIDDPRIHIFTKTNGGVSSARNYGIKKAKCTFIAFLDGDDQWGSKYLEGMYSLIKEYPLAEVYASNFRFVYPDKKSEQATVNIKHGYVENYFKSACQEVVIHSSSVIVRASVFGKVGIFNENISRGEDMDLWTRFGVHCKIAYSSTIANEYFIGTVNSSANFIPAPTQIFAYYIEMDKCVNFYHFRYLKRLLIKRTLRYLILDYKINYFWIMIRKQGRNILRTYNLRIL